MSGAPKPDNERQRLTALYECAVLDTPCEPAFDDLTTLLAEICEVPIALVSLLDEERQWFKSCIGLEITETPRDVAFCSHTILQDEALVVPDATQDSRFRDNPLVTGRPGLRFYAGVPLRTSDNLPLGTLCALDTRPREITRRQLETLRALGAQAATQLELRRTIQHLRSAQQAAEQASRAKSEFLANISHEIRTPMTAIVGFADLLGDAELTVEDRRTFTDSIRRNAAQLLTLLGDLLDLSRIEAGRLSIEFKTVRVAELVRGALSLVESAARQKELTLRYEVEPSTPDVIHTDVVRVRQILLHLLSNAIKFTRHGGVCVRVRAPQDGCSALEIDVVDSGIGIAAETLPLLFSPFVQGDTSATRPYTGTGLGLALSQRMAQVLKGSLTVRSAPGVGSTFTLRLPLTQPPQARLAPAVATAAQTAIANSPA